MPIIARVNETTKTGKAIYHMTPANLDDFIRSAGCTVDRVNRRFNFAAAGDSLEYFLQPRSVASWTAVTTLTKSNTTDEFRYSQDNGATYSAWTPLTTLNLAAITGCTKMGQDLLHIRHTATAAGYVSYLEIAFVYFLDENFTPQVTTTIEDREFDLLTGQADIKGTGFIKDTHSLTNIFTAITNAVTAISGLITAAQTVILAAIAAAVVTIDYIKRILDHIKTVLQRHDFAFLKRIGRNK
jgi:hypothetical protein